MKLITVRASEVVGRKLTQQSRMSIAEECTMEFFDSSNSLRNNSMRINNIRVR